MTDELEQFYKTAKEYGEDPEELINLIGIRMAMAYINPVRTLRTASPSIVSLMKKYFSISPKLYASAVALLLSCNALFGYTVKKGDSVCKITGAKSKDDPKVIEFINLNPDLKVVNGNPVLPVGKQVVLASEVSNRVYTVKKGDSLWKICKNQPKGMMEKLFELNPGLESHKNNLKIGEKIFVPSDFVFSDNKNKKSENISLTRKKNDLPNNTEIKEKNSKSINNDGNTDKNIDFIARVVYAETANCQLDERNRISQLIMNRIGNKNFGNPSDAFEVVTKKGQFSCIGDENNKNWKNYRKDLNKSTQEAYELAEKMMNGESFDVPKCWDDGVGGKKNVVYYHDHTLKTYPKDWAKYFDIELVENTTHFKFYRIIPKKKK